MKNRVSETRKKCHLLNAFGSKAAADAAGLRSAAAELSAAVAGGGDSVVRRDHVERIIAATDGDGNENVKTGARVRDNRFYSRFMMMIPLCNAYVTRYI